MEEIRSTCPLCGSSMNATGIGSACRNCGYIHVPSPVADKIKNAAKKKYITIGILVVLFGWVIPEIIMMFMK